MEYGAHRPWLNEGNGQRTDDRELAQWTAVSDFRVPPGDGRCLLAVGTRRRAGRDGGDTVGLLAQLLGHVDQDAHVARGALVAA